MQPMIVVCPRSGMVPMMLYCGPGPDRTLRGVMAVATVSAETGTATAALSVRADTKNVLLYRITISFVVGGCFCNVPPVSLFRRVPGTFELHEGPSVSRH